MRLADMAEYDLNIIFKNINKLIEAIGLNDGSIAAILEISIRKLQYIRSGKIDLKISDIKRFAKFFDIKSVLLSKEDLKVDFSLRDKLYKKYKKIPAIGVHFEITPSIGYALKYIFEQVITPEETKEVTELCELLQTKGWIYESSSVSQALSRLNNEITKTSHPDKKGTFLYSKKKGSLNSLPIPGDFPLN